MAQQHNDFKHLFDRIHEAACAKNEMSYLDPETGYTVFTRLFHVARGSCCGSGCRHCPYSPKHTKGQQHVPGDGDKCR